MIYNHAPEHVSIYIMDWIKVYNSHAIKTEKLVVEFVDPCLTSIYDPPDVVMNYPLKLSVWHVYHNNINHIVQDISTITKFKPGDKIIISRKTLIGFMEKAHDNINGNNIKNG